MNKNLLRSYMIRHGETQSDIAEVLDITRPTLSRKINGNGGDFTQREIVLLKEHYNLSPEEIDQIFFA